MCMCMCVLTLTAVCQQLNDKQSWKWKSERMIVLYVFLPPAKQYVYIISLTLVILFRIYHWRKYREMKPNEPNLQECWCGSV